MQLHFLHPQVVNALRLSPDKVSAKIKAGWRWHQLSPSFCAAGGCATYSRALVAPGGDIAYVSDRAAGPATDAEIAPLPVLEISHRMVAIQVPYADKDSAKALGAIWVGHKRTWACAPSAVECFSRWGASPANEFDMLADQAADRAELELPAVRDGLRQRPA